MNIFSHVNWGRKKKISATRRDGLERHKEMFRFKFKPNVGSFPALENPDITHRLIIQTSLSPVLLVKADLSCFEPKDS